MRWFLILALCGSVLASEQNEKEYQTAIDKAKAECDAKVKAAKDKFVASLKLEMAEATKKGDLDGALGIRAKINTLTAVDLTTIGEDKAKEQKNDDPDPDTITAAQWDATQGLEFKVLATKKLDTKIVLAKGDRVVVLPHPEDKWSGNPREEGICFKGKPTASFEGLPEYCFCVFVNNEKKKYGVINGEGHLFLQINDGGLDDNKGFIRAKIVKLK